MRHHRPGEVAYIAQEPVAEEDGRNAVDGFEAVVFEDLGELGEEPGGYGEVAEEVGEEVGVGWYACSQDCRQGVEEGGGGLAVSGEVVDEKVGCVGHGDGGVVVI